MTHIQNDNLKVPKKKHPHQISRGTKSEYPSLSFSPETKQSFSAHTWKPQSLVSLPPELQTWDTLDPAKRIKSVTMPALVKPQNGRECYISWCSYIRDEMELSETILRGFFLPICKGGTKCKNSTDWKQYSESDLVYAVGSVSNLTLI